MYKLLVSLWLVQLSFNTWAQTEDSVFIRRIADDVLRSGQSYDNLRDLTKNIGGRLAGSPQMVTAEKWGAKTLKNTGATNVWMQECMVPHWVRGGRDEVIVTGGNKRLSALALGNTIGTGPKGITADVVLIHSFDELEQKKDLVKGKIVFYNYKFVDTFISTSLAYGDAVTYRVNGASRAAKYGAVGMLLRSMSHSTDNFPHTGYMEYDSLYPKIPAVALGLRDADWLDKQLQKSKISVHLTTYGHFLPDTVGHNVIGELKGSEFPDQYITVGGHLDSWDPAEGAHDDGTGVVQTIEILKAFRDLGYTPKHTVRFVLFANEENGTRGADKYAEEAKRKNEKHLFALESDEGGFTPRGFSFEAKNEIFQKVSGWRSLFEPYGGSTFGAEGSGTDVSPLHAVLNIPVAGLNPDTQRYFDYHHSTNDVFENVNKRELELGAINMAALIYLVDKYGL